MLKEHLSEEEYQRYARAIAAAVDAVNVALLGTTYDFRPELQSEVEASIDRYDRFL
jgi:hypothetical protein